MKEQFGFIKCCDRDCDLFFHFSQAPGDISIGAEVSFDVLRERTNDKLSAGAVEILPAGTVVFEELVSENQVGVVRKEFRPPRDSRSFYGDRDKGRREVLPGRIELENPADDGAGEEGVESAA